MLTWAWVGMLYYESKRNMLCLYNYALLEGKQACLLHSALIIWSPPICQVTQQWVGSVSGNERVRMLQSCLILKVHSDPLGAVFDRQGHRRPTDKQKNVKSCFTTKSTVEFMLTLYEQGCIARCSCHFKSEDQVRIVHEQLNFRSRVWYPSLVDGSRKCFNYSTSSNTNTLQKTIH